MWIFVYGRNKFQKFILATLWRATQNGWSSYSYWNFDVAEKVYTHWDYWELKQLTFFLISYTVILGLIFVSILRVFRFAVTPHRACIVYFFRIDDDLLPQQKCDANPIRKHSTALWSDWSQGITLGRAGVGQSWTVPPQPSLWGSLYLLSSQNWLPVWADWRKVHFNRRCCHARTYCWLVTSESNWPALGSV